MLRGENSLSCLECSVHLPLPPELVKPVAIPGAKQVSVCKYHGTDAGPRGRLLGVGAAGEHHVVDEKLIAE